MNNKQFAEELEGIRAAYSEYCAITDINNPVGAPEISQIQQHLHGLEHHERILSPDFEVLMDILQFRSHIQSQIHAISLYIQSGSRRSGFERRVMSLVFKAGYSLIQLRIITTQQEIKKLLAIPLKTHNTRV